MTDEAIKTLELTETTIKERDNIKLVKIVRLAEINKKQYKFVRYDVRYIADDKRITGIATHNEESAIDLFNRIKRD